MDLLAKVIVILMYYFSVAHVGHSSSSAATPSQVLLPSFHSSLVHFYPFIPLNPKSAQSNTECQKKFKYTGCVLSLLCYFFKSLHKDIQFCFSQQPEQQRKFSALTLLKYRLQQVFFHSLSRILSEM